MSKHDDIGDRVIVALRRVIRAVDLHSRTLVASHGLTGPQALILKALQTGSLPAGQDMEIPRPLKASSTAAI